MRKIITLVFIIPLLVISHNNRSMADPSSDKFTVFQEFIQVIGAESQYNQIINVFMNQFKSGFTYAINQQIGQDKRFTDDYKEEVTSLIEKYMNNAMSKLENRFKTEIPFSELVTNVYYPAYEKHFDISELKDIIAYYKSPVGKKFISLSPTLMQDSMTIMNSLYNVKIQEISQQVAMEEMNTLQPEMEKLLEKYTSEQ